VPVSRAVPVRTSSIAVTVRDGIACSGTLGSFARIAHSHLQQPAGDWSSGGNCLTPAPDAKLSAASVRTAALL
jgi:hypothetical protein